MATIIREVTTKRELKEFIEFPNVLYKNISNWVPALYADEVATLSSKKNPAFKHCEAKYFLACQGENIVGRVAAIINYNANKDWSVDQVRFGWFDFIDDHNVSQALFDEVKKWGKEKGMSRIAGPLGFSDMDKEGLLIEGFENLPSITTLYNFPYYIDHYLALGLDKDIDWIQKRFKVPQEVPEKLKQFSDIVAERYKVEYFLPRRKRQLVKRAHEIFDALNESFTPLYEFTRLNEGQIKSYLSQYIPFINMDLCCFILDQNDKMVAFAITMPTLSYAMQKAKGKLFPFGFIHLLKALKTYDYIEMYIIGVVPEFQNKGLNAMIFNKLHSEFIKYKVKEVFTNPQLETNKAVLQLFDYYHSEPYMIRRCYSAII